MGQGILASIIAAAFVGLVVAAYRSPHFRMLLDSLFIALRLSITRRPGGVPPTLLDLRKRIIRLLVADQSLRGIHRGQFGKATPVSESKLWQIPNAGKAENIRIKPRMYLTYWPILIMHRHGVAPRSVSLARLSIESLFSNNRIRVAQSAAPNMAPDRDPMLISYRHTMAAALILSSFEAWNSITRSVLDAMLDPRNDWQETNGGWRQVSADFYAADVWASAYAAQLLAVCLKTNSPFSKAEKTRAQELLVSTLSFLEEQWNSTAWAFGELTSEEVSVPLYVELVKILKRWKPSMANDCLKVFSSWLSSGGDLSDTYKANVNHIPAERLYARMAYAHFLGQNDSSIWKILFERLAQGDLSHLNSAELSFVLDISYSYSDDASKKIAPTTFVGG